MNDVAVHQQAAAHDARNAQLLAKLAGKGVDLQAKRSIDLFFWANSESSAVRLVAALEAAQLAVIRTAAPSDERVEWGVEARAHASPQDVAAGDYTRSLVRLAVAHGARYDGWGTEL